MHRMTFDPSHMVISLPIQQIKGWNIKKNKCALLGKCGRVSMSLYRVLVSSLKETKALKCCTLVRSYTTPPPARSKSKDLYGVMGITPNATQQQIKEAYYKRSMEYHPDKNKNSKEAHTKFTELTEAYSVLGSHDLRKRYDKGLYHGHPHKHAPAHTASQEAHPHDTTVRAGQKAKFDFDEFYQAHYGEALKREREARRSAAEARERAKVYTISQNIQQVLIVSVVLSVLAVGWYGGQLKHRGKNYP